MFLTLLPFLGSGFVTETLRGLLTGTGIGINAIVSVAWCICIALASYIWARNRYEHHLPR
jgi:ABC-2 type transport system permease protein